MAVQLNIEYQQLIELVEQLSDDQRKDLIARLLTRQSHERHLTTSEKISLLEAAKLQHTVNEVPSIHREDWYGDDGR